MMQDNAFDGDATRGLRSGSLTPGAFTFLCEPHQAGWEQCRNGHGTLTCLLIKKKTSFEFFLLFLSKSIHNMSIVYCKVWEVLSLKTRHAPEVNL